MRCPEPRDWPRWSGRAAAGWRGGAAVARRSTSSKPSRSNSTRIGAPGRTPQRELQPAVLARPARRVIGELQAPELLPRQAPSNRAADSAISPAESSTQLNWRSAVRTPNQANSSASAASSTAITVRQIERQQRPGGDGEAERRPADSRAPEWSPDSDSAPFAAPRSARARAAMARRDLPPLPHIRYRSRRTRLVNRDRVAPRRRTREPPAPRLLGGHDGPADSRPRAPADREVAKALVSH